MKAVILSASTGGGHMSASYAIRDYLNSNNCSASVTDALEYINPLLNKTVTEIYEYIATKNPKLWKMLYKSSNNKSFSRLIYGTNSITAKKLLPLIEQEKPDIIITTHPFTTEMISRLKRHRKIHIPLICVMTDYAPHRTWINSDVDAYVVANENMITPMIEMDVDSSKIYPFGIPVDDAFFMVKNKKETMQEINLDENLHTILIMAGSCGFANVEKIYRQLQSIKPDFQIIIITGKNKKLYEKMQNLIQGKKTGIKSKIFKKISDKTTELDNLRLIRKIKEKTTEPLPNKKTKVIYFTNEVDKYMWISDLIITKPGGLTVSEALASNLPMVLYDAIPGQEEENANFLVSNNMAIKLDGGNDINEIIEKLLLNPVQLDSMKFNCTNFDKSNSLKNIFKLSQNLIQKTNKNT